MSTMCGEPLPLWQGSQLVTNHRCGLLDHLTGHSAGARGVLEVLKLPLELPGCSRRRLVMGFRARAESLPRRFPRATRGGRSRPDARWFFGTPGICCESHLLRSVIGLTARGGRSFTAIHDVHSQLWTRSATCFAPHVIANRSHHWCPHALPRWGTVAKTMTLSSGTESSNFGAPLPLGL